MSQKGNTVSGSIAGGDINETNNYNVFNFGAPTRGSSGDAPLFDYDRIEAEMQESGELREIVQQLDFYESNVDSPFIEFEKKLTLAGREDEIPLALRSKEAFAKLMAHYNLSRTAQFIFAYLLGRAWQLFKVHVSPLIAAGAGRAEVDAAIGEHVAGEIERLLGTNKLGIFHPEVMGIIYYLGSRCIISWHKRTA